MDGFGKLMDKIPTDKAYDDLLQPGMKKVGEALETIIDVGNLVLLPVKFITQKAKITLAANLKRYQEKLEKVNDICQMPEYVGLPIVSKLAYIDQQDLSEAFINLLTKASSKETLNLVHPAFINTLGNLCADEAKILFFLRDFEMIPVLDIYIKRYKEAIPEPDDEGTSKKTLSQLRQQINYTFQDRQEVKIRSAWNLTGIEKEVTLDFPENIDVYIENIERQGVIRFERGQYEESMVKEYVKLSDEIYSDIVQEIKSAISEAEEDVTVKKEFYTERGYIEFTEYGKMFLKACMNSL